MTQIYEPLHGKNAVYCSLYVPTGTKKVNKQHEETWTIRRNANVWGLYESKLILQKFVKLSSEWKQESAHLSSVEQMTALPSYQAIIGMGYDVVPCILNEMKKNSGHWFLALQTITGKDPAAGRGALRLVDLTELWIDWGKRVFCGHS